MASAARASGVLLHPTSLPGGQGIGDLGEVAKRFVDWLAACKQAYWQVLPLGPTGYGDSPYQSFSAFAGNPWLIDLSALVAAGWLAPEALHEAPPNTGAVDFGHVVHFKQGALKAAYQGFAAQASAEDQAAFTAFRRREAAWLDGFTKFMALKAAHGGACWAEWPRPLAMNEAAAVQAFAAEHAQELAEVAFAQWIFAQQWAEVRAYAASQHVALIGDVPIYVAYDSADVWANRELFRLDEAGRPTHVAGVPPDYFSATGQLWGNPLYRWDVLGRKRYGWWIQRMRQAFAMYDLVRLDHFRGFEAFWEVPAGHPTAEHGRWVKGPDAKLFKAFQRAFGVDLPIIAEDLGLITPEVESLRDGFDLPGMKILQFAFGDDATNAYLPHNFAGRSVAYTGTHDNDTSRGQFLAATPEQQDFARTYLGCDDTGYVRALIRAAWTSTAELALVPMQDLLDLGSEARMNTPSEAAGNWSWRMPEGALNGELQGWLAALTKVSGRDPLAESQAPEVAPIVVEKA